MENVWDRGAVAVSEVWNELARRRDVARNTVQTLIIRLEEKAGSPTAGRTHVFLRCRAFADKTAPGQGRSA
jgi:predicted transcriptional regulator